MMEILGVLKMNFFEKNTKMIISSKISRTKISAFQIPLMNILEILEEVFLTGYAI